MTDLHQAIQHSSNLQTSSEDRTDSGQRRKLLPPVERNKPQEHQTEPKIRHYYEDNIIPSRTEAIEVKLQRLRVLVRERDLAIATLKQENSILKQRERRSQKDIEYLEQMIDEAPVIIRQLKEDIAMAKNKMKVYYAQIGQDSRVIRAMNEEKLRLKQETEKLGSLVAEKDLMQRSTLSENLDMANKKIFDLQQLCRDTEKNMEMIERNLSTDNRHLRGRIHHLEKEKELKDEQIKKIEDIVKEKDKMIASLAIYRYNSIHRKTDSGCKKCIKREKEEAEQLQRMEILKNLPPLEIKQVEVVTGDSVKIQLDCCGEGYRFSKVSINYSLDPMLVENVKNIVIDNSDLQYILSRPIDVKSLISGNTYYFNVAASFNNITAPPSNAVECFVDQVPTPPSILKTSFSINPMHINVFIKLGQLRGSPVKFLRLYQSESKNFTDKCLILETNLAELHSKNQEYELTISDPHLGVPYYYKVTASNKMGESEFSNSSNQTLIDIVPNTPCTPIVKKSTNTSLQISAHTAPGLGTGPTHYVLCMKSSQIDGTELETKEFTFNRKSRDFTHILEDVLQGINYSFCIQAGNAIGLSDPSDWSENIVIDTMVPVLENLKVVAESDSSVVVSYPELKENKGNETKKSVESVKISWATDCEMENIVGSINLPAQSSKPKIISDLESGSTLYFAGCYVGSSVEGLQTEPICIQLAAFIPLPESPLPDCSGSLESIEREQGVLSKNGSFSSNLSLQERVANMHHGKPAHHDPPVVKISHSGSQGSLNSLRHRPTSGGNSGSVSKSPREANAPLSGKKSLRTSSHALNALPISTGKKGSRDLTMPATPLRDQEKREKKHLRK